MGKSHGYSIRDSLRGSLGDGGVWVALIEFFDQFDLSPDDHSTDGQPAEGKVQNHQGVYFGQLTTPGKIIEEEKADWQISISYIFN
jgi:hypothetical protein